MSKFLHYEPCPKCRDNGRDSRGDNLAIYSDGSAHCFAGCGFHRFPQHYVPKDYHESKHEKAALPFDFQREVPATAWKWLLQYGLPYSYWQPYTGYSPAEERLIFCVPDRQSMAFSIGRWIPQSGPGTESGSGLGSSDSSGSETGRSGRSSSNLQVPLQHGLHRFHVGSTGSSQGMEQTGMVRKEPRKWWAYGDVHRRPHVLGDYSESKEVVLVEDLLSGHKIGQVNAAIPLFGTQIHQPVVAALRHIGLPVVLWLDKDQEGLVQKKAMNLSLQINQPVRYIFTENDPKACSFETIKEVLK